MYFAFRRNFAGRMSQQQTPSQVSTANQQPLHELQWGNLPTLRDPSIRQVTLKGCPLSPKQPSAPTATEAMQVALNILSLPTLFQVHQPYVQARSARSILMEEAEFN